MKLHKMIDSTIKQNQAKVRMYAATQFGSNFTAFMEALEMDNLVPVERVRTKVATGHLWSNTINEGGIAIVTTKHPLLEDGKAGDVIVTGSKYGIELFENILKRYATFEGMDTSDLEIKIEYHEELNPALWTKDGEEWVLNPEVEKTLLKAGEAFMEFMKVPKVETLDIALTGSCANYNWTKSSDIDLHVVVDLAQAEEEYGVLIKEYFDAKKNVWNELHDIKVKGMPVEFYVQDEAEKHYSTGVYSLMNQEWVIKPEHKTPDIDDASIKDKAAGIMKQIDEVLESNKASAVEKVMDKVKALRKAGLEEAGEFSVGNLVFKVLRNNGYLEKLTKLKTKTFDRDLSVEEEEWNALEDKMAKLPVRQPYIHY